MLTEKYRHFTRDRHNILWTTYIYTSGFVNGTVLYGLLYPRYVVVDSRNIAAVGWHVPTKAEYETLIAYLGGASVAGGKLKDTGYTYWNSPNEGATNESGFTARGAGIRDYEFGTFSGKNLSTDLWTTTTEYGAYVVCELHYVTASAYLLATNPGYGASIRLIKDDSVLTPYGGNDGKQYRTVKIGNQVWMADDLCETKYRNEDPIPEVIGNPEWVALSTGALCSYDNNWDFAYTGYTIDLVGAGPEPAKIEYCNESDDPFDPIKSSRAIITAWANSMFAHDELYSTEDICHWVEIFQEEDLFWAGWVDPHQCAEPYGPVPYISTIYSTDGLTLLKAILYDNNGTYYTGRRLESQIVLDILDKIDFTEFKEYVNLYEETMDDGPGDSPFDQLSINTDIFKDMYCDEVLKEILKKYGACIRMVDGIFCIYRIAELTGATVYGRHFTGPVTKTAISFTPKQYIRRPSHLTALLEIKTGARMIQGPAKKVTIKQDYGNKESWLNNYQFKSSSYSRVTWMFNSWEPEGSISLGPVSDLIAGETEGFMFTTHNPNGQHVKCIYQNFGGSAVITSDYLMLSFEYAFYNNGITLVEDANFYIEIRNTASTRWLKATTVGDDVITDITWETGQNYIAVVEDSIPGFSGWMTFERKVPGLPVNGEFIIKIYASYEDDYTIFPMMKNVKFFTSAIAISLKAEKRIVPDLKRKFIQLLKPLQLKEIYVFPSEQKTVIEREYTAENPINGKELEYDTMLGDVTDVEIDNMLEQFAGSLAVLNGSVLTPAAVWHTRGGSEDKALLQIVVDEIASHYSRPKHFLDLPILEVTKAASTLNLLGNFQDTINTFNNYLRAFAINRGSFDIKMRKWQFDLIEIGQGEPSEGGPESVTVDTTEVTVDSTEITVDHT
jgi:uncharacterized protein (TIGR02145 family)